MLVSRERLIMSFDEKTQASLKYYVYVLSNPDTKKPFYVGKGKGNRVFNHVACALDTVTESDKYDTIRAIVRQDKSVRHCIIRHGLDEKTAIHIESAIIDLLTFLDYEITNQVRGHHSIEKGLATTDEIIRQVNAKPLKTKADDAVIININKSYKRGSWSDGIYQATKQAWVIGKNRPGTIKVALAEYKGLIVEVFSIDEWYPVNGIDKNGKPKLRWGFNGKVAPKQTREQYINKSVAHIKVRGASNPLRFNM